ncbi:MAG: hypothetical protein ACOCSL_03215 [Thermoplasmatota archaeon]
MPLPEDRLLELFESFKQAEEDELSEDVQDREEKKRKLKEIFSEENLDELEEGNIRELVRNLWTFQMWTNKDYLADEMLSEGVEYLQDKFKEALEETESKEQAYGILVEDIPMMGAAAASEILASLYPDKCAIWNRKARDALEILSYSDRFSFPISKKHIDKEEYGEFNKIMKELADTLQTDEYQMEDLLELDYFLYYILEEEEIERDEEEESVEEFEHDEIKEIVQEIGDGLGFDVDVEYKAAPGARIDVRWSAKVANSIGLLTLLRSIKAVAGTLLY